MHSHVDPVTQALVQGPLSSRDLQDRLSMSQATVSRAITALGDAAVRVGVGRTVFYSLIDSSWPSPVPVYRVDSEGRLQERGALIPVRPDGLVMQPADGPSLHSDGLPLVAG
jgi:biotin operon repressor